MLQNLAQQINAIRSGTHPGDTPTGSNVDPEQVPPENCVPAFLEIEDLKRKVACLIEQVGQHTQETSTLNPVIPRVDLMQNQITRWRYRLPDMATDNDDKAETVAIAIEAREELQALKEADRRRIAETREVITALEDRVNILRRASAALTDGVTEVERLVQSQIASLATTNDQNPSIQENSVQFGSRIEARLQYNDNIREERWTHFSMEGVKFLTATVDVIQRGGTLALLERDLIIHLTSSRSLVCASIVGWGKTSSRTAP